MRVISYPFTELKGKSPEWHDWGPWRIEVSDDPKDRWAVLVTSQPYAYEVDLYRCRTSAEVLDWIIQINDKEWANSKVIVAGLIAAIRTVLNPQGTLCGFGNSKSLTVEQIHEYARNVANRRASNA